MPKKRRINWKLFAQQYETYHLLKFGVRRPFYRRWATALNYWWRTL